MRAFVGAVLLVLVVAQPAVAVTWGADVKLSSTNTSDHELERTGADSAIAAWQRGSGIVARRTVNGGQTWLPAQTLATGVGLGSGLAASGADVDLVYVRTGRCRTTGDVASRLYYRHSSDGGATWATPRALTSSCSRIVEPDVARSADGQVSVVWTGLNTGRVLMMTSTDGGASFGGPVQVATSTNSGGDTTTATGQRIYIAEPTVAIGGGGTTYVAYTSARDTLSVRRSLNRGATWSAATRLTTASINGAISLVADGARAAVGYTVDTGAPFRAVVRTTLNRGATWSAQRSVVNQDADELSMEPELATDGTVLALIVKFGPVGNSPIWYRESANWGATWGSTIRFSPGRNMGDPEPAGIALLASDVVAGHAENGEVPGLWVRSGGR